MSSERRFRASRSPLHFVARAGDSLATANVLLGVAWRSSTVRRSAGTRRGGRSREAFARRGDEREVFLTSSDLEASSATSSRRPVSYVLHASVTRRPLDARSFDRELRLQRVVFRPVAGREAAPSARHVCSILTIANHLVLVSGAFASRDNSQGKPVFCRGGPRR